MKVRSAVFSALVLLAVYFAAGTVFQMWVASRTVMPGQANESAFLLAYKPGQVIEQFWSLPGSSTWGSSAITGSGDGHYIPHALEFRADLVIHTSQEAQLVSALRDDILRRVNVTHTRLTKRSVEPDGAYRFDYKNGNSAGSISVQPPEHPVIQRDQPLAEGLEDIQIRLRVEERWNEWCIRCTAN